MLHKQDILKSHTPSFSVLSDHQLVERLSKDDELVFNYIVSQYYTRLCRFCLRYVRYEEPAEEIVQDVFVALWERRNTLHITTSLNAYLFTAVKYSAINHLKKQLRTLEFQNTLSEENHPVVWDVDNQIDAEALKALIAEPINKLPKKCRIIFDLSRNAGLTYAEIAAELNISVKTVETQMTLALSKMRGYLTRYWDKIIIVPLMMMVS